MNYFQSQKPVNPILFQKVEKPTLAKFIRDAQNWMKFKCGFQKLEKHKQSFSTIEHTWIFFSSDTDLRVRFVFLFIEAYQLRCVNKVFQQSDPPKWKFSVMSDVYEPDFLPGIFRHHSCVFYFWKKFCFVCFV